MKTTVVRYKVKADQAEENRRLVQEVFSALDAARPDGLRYVTFNLDDGVTFIHVAVLETEDGSNPLNDTPAFQAFTAEIRDRCEEPPVAKSAEIVGSYRLFWERFTDTG